MEALLLALTLVGGALHVLDGPYLLYPLDGLPDLVSDALEGTSLILLVLFLLFLVDFAHCSSSPVKQ